MKKIIFISFGLLLIGVAFYFYIIGDFKKTPSTLYYNGNIITLNDQQPITEAMFVENGVIKAIGSNDELADFNSNDINTIDLKGTTVLPGFIDAHTHFALSMFLSEMHDLSGFTHKTNTELWNSFEEKVRKTEKGKWIVCRGIDPILTTDLIIPTISYLDSIAPENPVLIFSQSLHSYWANSNAFEKAGINNKTPNPSAHSYYEKDINGNLTGLIAEQEALKPFVEVVKEEYITAQLLSKASIKVMSDYARNGNTTIVSAGLTINDEKPLILLKHLSDRYPSFVGNLLAKLNMLPERIPTLRHFIYIRHDKAFLLPENRDLENDFYNILGVKHWYDGSPYIGSMYMESPYMNGEFTEKKLSIPKDHRGHPLIEKLELINFIKENHDKGWQLAFHVQGDAATKEIIDAFEEVSKTTDIKNGRHRLEHCLMLQESELTRVKELGLTPSFHINHLYFYGDALKKDIIGADRAEKILPLKSTKLKGVNYSLHADQPMFESKPFRLIQTAIERKTVSGDSIGVNQKIELLEALKSMTIYAAWQINMEDKLGSLEKGKYADFILLDKNPFKIPVSELENIKCTQTFVNGNSVNY